MTILVSAAEAQARRFHVQLQAGSRGTLDVTSYIGMTSTEARNRGISPEGADGGAVTPIAYLTRQHPGSFIPGHFHQADQFQVFVGGNGRFGSKPLTGISVHYAGAFTPYAPIDSQDSLVEYFVFRTRFDPGPRWMPQSKDELFAQPRKYRAELGAVDVSDAREDSKEGVEDIIPDDGSGLGAWVYRVRPEETIRCREPAAGRAQFFLVLKGNCRVNGERADERSVCYAAHDEPAVTLTGQDAPAHVLLVQFANTGLGGR